MTLIESLALGAAVFGSIGFQALRARADSLHRREVLALLKGHPVTDATKAVLADLATAADAVTSKIVADKASGDAAVQAATASLEAEIVAAVQPVVDKLKALAS